MNDYLYKGYEYEVCGVGEEGTVGMNESQSWHARRAIERPLVVMDPSTRRADMGRRMPPICPCRMLK